MNQDWDVTSEAWIRDIIDGESQFDRFVIIAEERCSGRNIEPRQQASYMDVCFTSQSQPSHCESDTPIATRRPARLRCP